MEFNILRGLWEKFLEILGMNIFIFLLYLSWWLIPIINSIIETLNFDYFITYTIIFIIYFLIIFIHSILTLVEKTQKEYEHDFEKKNKEFELEIQKKKREAELEIQKKNREFQIRNNDLSQKIAQKENLLTNLNNSIEQINADINNIKSNTQQHLTKLTSENTVGYPWLAELYADISYIEENKLANYLKDKQRPALKASEQIQNIAKEKRDLTIKLKIYENQLKYYETVFPWLEEFKEVDPIEAYETINNTYSDDEYSRVKNYLSPEEYSKLSNAEKYQLALERYKNNPKKTAWQIGIDYERYIGYIYERKGYKVIYNGALEGLEDMGRDIIAENNNEILIIQCKYWKKEKTIHEKHIFQLYGTVILKKLETNKTVKGIFITSAKLSKIATIIANDLKIEIKEEIPFNKDYPCIKCNINRKTGEKIYHLPFDQQYDKILIEQNRGESYVKTTKEAEEKGFRHALKHYIE